MTCASLRHVALRLACLLVPAAGPLGAQVGSTTDILTGVVKNPAGQPVAGATVTVTSVETQVSRSRRTDDKGRYVLVFPEGGGRYQLAVKALGFEPVVQLVNRVADEDQLVTNVTMGAGSAQRLDQVVVRAAPRAPPNDRPAPGATERAFSPDQVMRLPIEDQSDLTALAALAPGVVSFAGSDSTTATFSVAGQRTTQNSVTLDGMTFGSTSVPQDAVRNTRIITNTYDIARGQFSGGQIASTTRSGTNLVQGSLTDAFRDPDLSWNFQDAGAFGQAYRQNTLSGGVGAPIIRDRLFIFGAFQLRGRSDPVQSLLSATPATLARLGANRDSIAAFLARVSLDSVPLTLAGIPTDRPTDGDQYFLRMDANLGDDHTLMLRYDTRDNRASAVRTSALALPTVGGTQDQAGKGAMAMLTSHVASDRGAFINELRAYQSWSGSGTDPYLVAPTGRVQLVSSLPATGSGTTAGAIGATTLQFGGNASLPQASRTTGLEVSNELSYIPAGSPHRFKLGLLLNTSDFGQDITTNRWGTYTYASLADFQAGTPSSFTRTLTPRMRTGGATNAAVYLGDTWRARTGLQLTYGIRAEGSSYAGAPAANPAVDTLFGVQTNRFPGEFHASPRIGFTWVLGASEPSPNAPRGGERGGGVRGGGGGGRGGGGGGGFGGFGGGPGGGTQPTTIVRGGFGEFRGVAPTGLFSAAQAATGLTGTEQQLTCVGPSVPAVTFSDWLTGTTPVPSSCAGSTPVLPGDPRLARPNVTVLDPAFAAPRSWRASLGVTHRLGDRLAVSLDLTYARGVAQYGYRDLNLVSTPAFTLDEEGGRPVYVPSASIVPATGTASSALSRVHPEFGRVLLTSSDLESDTRQATVSVQFGTMRGLNSQLSYTYTRSIDQTSFPGSFGGQGVASTTAGDPNRRTWATSDVQRVHQVVLTASYPITGWFELTGVGRVVSGAPFTPVVGNDINGDGARNDQAFVFDPATAVDTAVGNGMQRLMAAAPAGVRECLAGNLGRVAARSSCTGPWTGSFDLQVNLRPAWAGLDRRLTISLSTINLLAGLDRAIHGDNNLAGWGQAPRPDPTLLTVRGYDNVRRAYLYQVNERFGQTNAGANAYRTPFQVSLQARLTFGPDPVRDRMNQIFGANRDSASRLFSQRFAQLIGHPIDSILVRRDSLALTDAQVAALEALRDSLSVRNGPVSDSLRARFDAAGPTPDPRTALADMAPLLRTARENVARALEQARAVLLPEQWARVPESIRNPRNNLRIGPGGGQGRPGGQRPPA
ncbi:MAG: carboxypeptidase regulatory-like domain-containing protein [Gemmatimonadetes bacterium]|nr:carboxypeptidase regulatory-like domain-containing protein [Gemmatimonadota bacterium]